MEPRQQIKALVAAMEAAQDLDTLHEVRDQVQAAISNVESQQPAQLRTQVDAAKGKSGGLCRNCGAGAVPGEDYCFACLG